MIRGLYTAATAMNVQVTRMDLVSNDLANVNTTGYKKDFAVVSSFEEELLYRMKDIENNRSNNNTIGYISPGARIEDIYTQFTQASFVETGDKNNFAIQGEGFFQVQTPDGLRYTRDGNFSFNEAGSLVTKEGYAVMGEDGPIELGEEYLDTNIDIVVGRLGTIRLGLENVGKLALVNFEEPQALLKQGDNLYISEEEGIPADATIYQGYLEVSNVNAVEAMVDMITISRAYEMSQKMIQVHDQLLGKAVNEIGKA
ncbi:flagellar basal-body rod protein FlgF [Candidatus Epulonipiscium fishelsonii]|uniref:Flagellar basal-body rod protein FlgF n=1 Tax=Candidatus Epulonipiscium fishelsonii TaxID=77094 RepID=A0ACC8XGQ0_9FIRM|nr:flagellar basal-body rod protein FlgF [Epulopiscium sp. SCG-D08WGA-EpuloA1]